MELEEMIRKCKSGERQAQDLLYKSYSQQMLRICYRFVQDKQIAQDLMHDGFIVIFASIKSLQQSGKLESWMRRIMTNLALRYINQTRSIPIIPISELSEDQQPIDEEPFLDLIPIETLLTMVEKLPEGYRNVFKLSVLDGLSHKEIADVLHIAPHSSSSQFYHAKEYLKKMIVQYQLQLMLLLLLLIPISYFIFWKNTQKSYAPQKSVQVNIPIQESIEAENENPAPACKKYHARQNVIAKTLSPDTIISHPNDASVDTIGGALPTTNEPTIKKRIPDNRRNDLICYSTNQSKWALTFKYNGGRKTTDVLPRYLKTPNNVDASSSIPSYTDNWKDYYQYLQKYGHTMADQKEMQSLMNIAQRNNGKIEERKQHYMPFTVELFLHKSINEHWGFEAGLNYTQLVSDFETGINSFISERQNLQYMGIPVRGIYVMKKFKRISIYSSIGMTLEIPIAATLNSDYIIIGKLDYRKHSTLNAPLQWSVNGGLGFQYQIMPSINLFVEPNLYYYFNDGSELKTIRKEHPFSFSLPIGVRFSY